MSEQESLTEHRIKSVCIVGGTHGDEWTGEELVKKMVRDRIADRFPSFETEFLIGNPRALLENRRFLDVDLNRSFLKHHLSNSELTGYEEERAKSINAMLGPKDQPRIDFVIDLHTIPSPMRKSVVLTKRDAFSFRLVEYLQREIGGVSVFFDDLTELDDPCLNSVGKRGIVFECGPVPRFELNYDVFREMEEMVMTSLNFIETYDPHAHETDISVPVFYPVDRVKFPNSVKGGTFVPTKSLLNCTFKELRQGMEIFENADGELHTYQGPNNRYPVFVYATSRTKRETAFTSCQLGTVTVSKLNETEFSPDVL